MSDVFYKIRRDDGLFSTGGTSPYFNEDGKVWHKRGHLSNHLAQFNAHQIRGPKSPYAGCKIVSYVATPVGSESLDDYLRGVEERRQKRQAERDRAVEEARRAALEHEYNRIGRLLGK